MRQTRIGVVLGHVLSVGPEQGLTFNLLAGVAGALTVAAVDNTPLAGLALGDIITLPDGRDLTVRSLVSLTQPVGSMAGFVLLGELELLLSIPSLLGAPDGVYLPIERFPVPTSNTRCASEGAARYWAPHLPALGQAMGEIYYRVIEVRGSIDPVVVIYRGPEAVVFVRTGYTFDGELRITALRRDPSNENVDVDRHAADVVVAPAPAAADVYADFVRR